MKLKFLSICIIILSAAHMADARFYIPVIDGDWWQIASTPDLGQYNSDKQQPVDFCVWQSDDGNWHLWSCIRFTKLGGHTRLLYEWQGAKLTDTNWPPVGIAMMGDPQLGEPLGGLQAPHVIKHYDQYWMAYGDWDNMRMATSKDGSSFKRLTSAGVLFSEGPRVNTRDPMLIFTKNKWHCYYTAFPAQHGYVYCRTSDDLLSWSQPVIVSYGGKAGNNPYSCECPQVVEVTPGNYFLFRTQLYGPGAQTTVYNSENPYHFGIDNDTYYVRQFNLCAPEIVTLDGKYYIVALNSNLDGVRVARLKWKCFEKPVFQFDNEKHRSQWKLEDGTQKNIFTNSVQEGCFAKTDFFISTAKTASPTKEDTLTGVIESPAFTVTTPDCVLYLSGGNNAEKLYVSIRDAQSDKEYVHLTGSGHDLLNPVFVDCQAFMNKQVVLKIIDNTSEAGQHICFGGIYEANPKGDL